MQAITLAIGKTGISFFAQQYLAAHITTLLQGLNPPNREISIDQFSYTGEAGDTMTISNMTVELSNGTLSAYDPAYQGIGQALVDGITVFTLNFPAGACKVSYAWLESYQWNDVGWVDVGGNEVPYHHSGNQTNKNNYTPAFAALNVQVIVQFVFNTQANAWQVSVQSATGNASGETPNIPGNSVLQNQKAGNGCDYSSHVSDATAAAVDAIDFSTPINALISGILATIPGSGILATIPPGNNILYDFSLGDSGLAFPNEDGIQMGVKGGASYNNTPFPGDPPPSLPLPAPLADTDPYHLNMYISNYEIDALTWAFYMAGNLNAVINATDLPDPAVLKVSTYVSSAPALEPYQFFAMQAQIAQQAPPVTSFQLVYQLTAAVYAALQNQLPASDWNQLSNLQGNNYVSLAGLVTDLTGVGINSNAFSLIENAMENMAMVVTHNITFTLSIQNEASPEPNIVFSIQRVDILSNLNLNINSNQAQTMQFTFSNATWNATFISSSILNFDGAAFSTIWPMAGEPEYAQLLTTLGSLGVPVPIMQGFQFDFANAQLSVQEGYVSIVANVQYNS